MTKKDPDIVEEFEKIYNELIDLMTKPKPFLYKTSFHRENRKGIKKVIEWINTNGGDLKAEFYRVPHDFIEMEIR